ncbi:MAG: histidinol-phosphate transaminase [Rhodocyclaceae bacterium]|jgi:histidinol-phosphate aminotransferase|nr:histidinol-phosphate transaminase [Rhodocyclaceae bacterium]
MSIAELAPAYIRAISPYLPGKPITELAREMGIPVEKIVKLASNENPLGMSPKARTAVEKALAGIERYPDDYELKKALSGHVGLGMERIVLGNGSNDVLDLAARVFLAPGRSAVFSRHAFAVYPLATMSSGAECIQVPAKDYGHDLTAMREAIRPDTRVVWIANPNNPTGNFLPHAQVKAFLRAVPRDVIVILDEAYNEYLPPAERGDSVAWLAEFPNLIITRTFSKVFGLAGLRVGYGLTSAEIADLMNRVRQPFNVNNLALAGAIAALDDHAFVAESYKLNRRGMEQIVAGLKRHGLEHIPSHGNFVTFKVGDAVKVNQSLLKQGVIVRPIAGYGLPQHLRVTIGLESENLRFLQALEHALEGAR